MALKLKEFARSDIKSEQIHNSPSDDDSDDGILYLPPPAAGNCLEDLEDKFVEFVAF